MSYSQLLAETRMRQAAHLLEGTDMPVAEIAFALGYTDASNLAVGTREPASLRRSPTRNRRC